MGDEINTGIERDNENTNNQNNFQPNSSEQNNPELNNPSNQNPYYQQPQEVPIANQDYSNQYQQNPNPTYSENQDYSNAQNYQENTSYPTSQTPMQQSPVQQSPPQSNPPVNQGNPYKDDWFKGKTKIALISILIIFALILLAGSVYLITRSPEAISTNSNLRNTTAPKSNSTSDNAPPAIQFYDPKNYSILLNSISCEKEGVNLSATLLKGNLDKVMFTVYYENEKLNLFDNSSIKTGDTKKFSIKLTGLEEPPWRVQISGINDGKLYGVISTYAC